MINPEDGNGDGAGLRPSPTAGAGSGTCLQEEAPVMPQEEAAKDQDWKASESADGQEEKAPKSPAPPRRKRQGQ